MSMKAHLTKKLTEAIEHQFLEILDESHLHNTPPGSESHFKVVIVSDVFQNKLRVKRHQHIYGILSEEMSNHIHALALHTYTPEEWKALEASAPATPDCRGGSKR